ncbi:MAG: hypothetical protein ACFCVG_16960 [Kineosporiaceae bacterium]
MGLGGGRGWWEDYEWFRLADVADLAEDPPAAGRGTPEPLRPVVRRRLRRHPVWRRDGGRRILLVDLDNLRSRPEVWRGRMALVAELARQSDDVVISGQQAAVGRAAPYLGRYAAVAQGVAHGDDLADLVLLAGADEVRGERVQIVVVSNDGIFARLARRGRLTVVSPGADALSDRLAAAADRVVDLVALES